MSVNNLFVAITGGVASGKSIALNYFKKKGYSCIDGDKMAKDIQKRDENLKMELRCVFGEKIINSAEVDSKALGEIVFSDKEKLDILISIMRKAIIKEVRNLKSTIKSKNNLVFVEASALFEYSLQSAFDYIVCIKSSENHQLERMIDNRKIKEELARKIITIQDDISFKLKNSDYIIDNESSLDEFISELQKLEEHLKLKFKRS